MNFTFSKKNVVRKGQVVSYSHLSLQNHIFNRSPIYSMDDQNVRNTKSTKKSRTILGNLYTKMYELHSQTQTCSSCGK